MEVTIMANLKITPGADLRSGKHSGQSIQVFSQGTSIKNKNQPHIYRTLQTDYFRKYLLQCVRVWHLLPPGTQAIWNNWATTFPQSTNKNPTKFLSGYNLFVKRNYYLFLTNPLGFEFMTNPIFEVYPTDIPSIQLLRSPAVLHLSLEFPLQSNRFDNIFFISFSQSTGKEYISTQWRETTYCRSINQQIDITDLFISTFGDLPAINDSIFLRTIIFGHDQAQQVLCPKIKSIVTASPVPSNPWGSLYNWFCVNDSKLIAPLGFHIPTFAEFNTLFDFLGGYDIAGSELKLPSLDFWYSIEYASNSTGFSGIGSGVRQSSDGIFTAQKAYGSFWCLGNAYDNLSAFATLQSGTPEIVDWYAFTQKTNGFSLRYIKDSGTTDSVTGNDGKVYPCVSIGFQCWTAVNSSETKFRDGTNIPGYEENSYHPISNDEWITLSTPRVCVAPWAL